MIKLSDFARKPVDHRKQVQRYLDTMPDTKPLREIDQHLFGPLR